jgi:hypothetical protein
LTPPPSVTVERKLKYVIDDFAKAYLHDALRWARADLVRKLRTWATTLQWSLDWRPRLEADMLAAGAHPVDALQPLPTVTDEVIRLASSVGIHLNVGKDT